MKTIIHTLALLFLGSSLFAKDPVLKVSSPDGNLVVNLTMGEKLSHSSTYKKKTLLLPSSIALILENGTAIGARPRLLNSKVLKIRDVIRNVTMGKRNIIRDEYNELAANFKGNYSLIVRVYNEGFAYRFKTNINDSLVIKNEEATFNFPVDGNMVYIPKEKMDNDGEGTYTYEKISQMPDPVFALVPAMVQISEGLKVSITESDLRDYAGFNLRRNKEKPNSLVGQFPTDVAKEGPNGWVYKVLERRNYIAKTNGKRSFPWRVVAVAEKDYQFTDYDLVYKLAPVPEKNYGDLSWIKSGKASWDWWYDWSIEGVDFKGEMESFEFYKWVIDWTAKNNLEYMEVSVGWMNDQNILDVSKKIRMPELVQYAKSKNVKILVWLIAHTLERQFDPAFDLFNKLGVAGIKVDFMDADHQTRIKFYERIAEESMKRKLLVYYHGACKPTGLERTYPCIINYEGVQANEYNKMKKTQTPKHSVNVAYLRNMAGGMDFNLGPMRNAQGDAFTISDKHPMSQGTRCHQLAMYVVYYAPLQMVSDAPSTYMKELESMNFIASVPASWDDSKPLDGKIGEYIVMARRKSDTWFLGAINNETPRTLNVNLDFLGEGKYKAFVYADGVNAHKVGTDYKLTTQEVTKSSSLAINLATGGGYAVRFEKIN